MAVAQFIHDGDSIDYTPTSADVAAGDVIVQGDLVGIAKRDIPAGALGALAVTGVFDMPKLANAGVTIAAGAKVYWDALSPNRVTTGPTTSTWARRSAAADATRRSGCGWSSDRGRPASPRRAVAGADAHSALFHPGRVPQAARSMDGPGDLREDRL